MTKHTLPEICHCGKPIHLSAGQKLLYQMMLPRWSDTKKVIYEGKTYLIPTYYIIVHGLKGKMIPLLGFKEFKEEKIA